MSRALILSCEHGGNEVPREYAALFSSRKAERALANHLTTTSFAELAEIDRLIERGDYAAPPGAHAIAQPRHGLRATEN